MSGRRSAASGRDQLSTAKPLKRQRRPVGAQEQRHHREDSFRTSSPSTSLALEAPDQVRGVDDELAEALPPPPPLPQATFWLRGSWRPVLQRDDRASWASLWSKWAASPAGYLEPESSRTVRSREQATEPTNPEMLISRAQTCLRQWFERYNQGLQLIEATTRMDPDTLSLHETWSTCDQLVRELVQVLNALRPWQALAQLLHLSVGQIAEKRQMLASINASKANALRSVLEQGIETDTLPSGVRSSGSERTTRPEEQKEDDDDDHGAKEPSCDRTRPEHSSLATLRNGSTASLAIAQRRLMNALLDMARRGDPHTGIGSRAAARGGGGGGQASAKTSR